MRSADFHQSGAQERRIFFEDTLIFAEGERHAELKQLFRPLMSRSALAYYELHLLEPVISNVFVDGVDAPERTERFAQLLTRMGEAVTVQWTKRGMDEVIAEGRKTLAKLVEEFLQPSLDRRLQLAERFRQGDIAAEELPRDMLMTMCLANDICKPDDAARIPYVWRQCSLFLNAAIHATSITLPHPIFHLDTWVREHPEDADKLTDPALLRNAATENLRLHQSSPVKFRDAVADVTLSTGRKVKAGETVALFRTPVEAYQRIGQSDHGGHAPHDLIIKQAA